MGCVLLFGGHPMEFFEHQPKKNVSVKVWCFRWRVSPMFSTLRSRKLDLKISANAMRMMGNGAEHPRVGVDWMDQNGSNSSQNWEVQYSQ